MLSLCGSTGNSDWNIGTKLETTEEGGTYIDHFRELLGDVGVHLVMFSPGCHRSVNVETGRGAKVPLVVLAWNIDPPGTGVGECHRQTVAGSFSSKLDPLSGHLVVASEASEEVEDRRRRGRPRLVGHEE